LRYFHLVKLNRLIAHERLTRICFVDYDREMALVVDYKNPQTGTHEILAAGRLSKLHGVNEAEFAMLVSDPFQCKGIDTKILQKLIQMGKDEKLEKITASILSQNGAMQQVSQKVGFTIKREGLCGWTSSLSIGPQPFSNTISNLSGLRPLSHPRSYFSWSSFCSSFFCDGCCDQLGLYQLWWN
jgi:GNAT superfamily N-acetyltransferase